jgi:hypothetical protein
MPMIHCHECGEKISDSAKACPKCGAKQRRKSANNTPLWILIGFIVLGLGGYIFKDTLFPGSDDKASKINIPNGRYMIVKQNNKGLDKFLHIVEQATVQFKGLGNQLNVIGDSIQSSDLFSTLSGGPTTFAIEKTAADNMFYLDLPGNKLSMELTSQKRLRLYIGSDSLVYEKE